MFFSRPRLATACLPQEGLAREKGSMDINSFADALRTLVNFVETLHRALDVRVPVLPSSFFPSSYSSLCRAASYFARSSSPSCASRSSSKAMVRRVCAFPFLPRLSSVHFFSPFSLLCLSCLLPSAVLVLSAPAVLVLSLPGALAFHPCCTISCLL